MSELPRVTTNDFVERDGVIAVQVAVNEARCVWREVEQRDIGIDGHIEYVTPEGLAPGRLVAVQVKSGESYFNRADAHEVRYSPSQQHRRYWSEYPLPVILVLHRPSDSETIWADARQQLRIGTTVVVPRANRFDTDGVVACLESSGPLPGGNFDPDQVVSTMAAPFGPQELCFLYMFAQGITDVAQAIYFGMDVVSQVLDYLAADHGVPEFQIGPTEFSFVDEYVGFLVAKDLARVDFASWKQVLDERGMVGTFIAPLTARGRLVRDRIAQLDTEVSGHGRHPAIQDRFVQMLVNPVGRDEFGERQERLVVLRRHLASLAGG